MKNTFKHRCSPRACPKAIPEFLGAGSGGGPVEISEITTSTNIDEAAGSQTRRFDGAYSMVANKIELLTRPALPPAEPLPYLITLFSAGMGEDGRVEIGGSQGVRVTAGPPMLPPASSESTNGVEVIVGEMQEITVQRGLIEEVDQVIKMTPGAILVDGGVGTVTIQSMTEVKLQVADGLSSITLTPAGIIIQGLLVSIN